MKNFLVFYIVFLFSMSVKTQELTPEPTIDFKILKAFKRSHVDTIEDKKLIQSQLHGLQIESENVYRMFEFSRPIHLTQGGEGSGTRGGGSGVAQISNEGAIISVDALEIYRSKNRDQYSGFFSINPNYEAKPDHLTEEQWSEEIIDIVLQKLKAVLPEVSQLLQQTREDLNISNWIDSHSRLPLIDDYIGNTMESKQVQIAYRMYDQFVYDKFLFEKMLGLSRAAIKLHEFIYAFSNTNQSLTTQRFVSLLLSTDLDSQLKALKDFKKARLTKQEINNLPILSLLIRLNLSRLSVEASLPEGLQIGEFSPNVFYSCGKIQNIEFDKTNNEMKLWILNPSDKISNVILSDKK
ncbi:MAG TPA: hypothetical protein PLJ21_00400, partial [Pseudobdellovibrionaceae bacterium]|nr:hypothetical protein [Pseudobdellovibrionaceae bacterium]